MFRLQVAEESVLGNILSQGFHNGLFQMCWSGSRSGVVVCSRHRAKFRPATVFIPYNLILFASGASRCLAIANPFLAWCEIGAKPFRYTILWQLKDPL